VDIRFSLENRCLAESKVYFGLLIFIFGVVPTGTVALL